MTSESRDVQSSIQEQLQIAANWVQEGTTLKIEGERRVIVGLSHAFGVWSDALTDEASANDVRAEYQEAKKSYLKGNFPKKDPDILRMIVAIVFRNIADQRRWEHITVLKAAAQAKYPADSGTPVSEETFIDWVNSVGRTTIHRAGGKPKDRLLSVAEKILAEHSAKLVATNPGDVELSLGEMALQVIKRTSDGYAVVTTVVLKAAQDAPADHTNLVEDQKTMADFVAMANLEHRAEVLSNEPVATSPSAETTDQSAAA